MPSVNLADVTSAKPDVSAPTNSDSQKPHVASLVLNQQNKDMTNNDNQMPPTSVENLQARDQQLKAGTKATEGPRRVDGLLKAAHADDGSTQLSSDSSAKPPSIDGKSVTSGATFALDEKESLRPDDSASVKATEEEDLFSPPDSNPPDSRVGSDHGHRNFHDQLHEITSMGPIPNRAPPAIKLAQPTGQAHGPPMLFNPSAAQSQPVPLQMASLDGLPETVNPLPDEKLLEAVESPRDRLFVMKLEQDFIDFVKDKEENSLDLPQCNGFYRMLAHRLADYYLLGHTLDSSINAVRIWRTPFCRIPRPLTGPSNPSTSNNTPPPNMTAPKIMRRGDGEPKSANNNEPTPEIQERAAGDGQGDKATDKDAKPRMPKTREEKEIMYKQAKERIWGPDHAASDVAEKPIASEEKDNSRSSSTTGKKKGKNKQRKNSDDGFELRSQYEPYYPTTFPINGFGTSDGSGYNAYPMYNTVSQRSSPTSNMQPFSYTSGYPNMGHQAPAAQNLWHGHPFSNFHAGQESHSLGSLQDNTFNLNTAFQQMSFQPSTGFSSSTPSPYGNVYQDALQDMSRSASQQQQLGMWPQMPYQGLNQPNQASFFPSQPTVTTRAARSHHPYPYGQLPQGLTNGKAPQNQHPVPGSFSRQQFNPQSQAFVPNHMVPQPRGIMPQIGTSSLNNFPNLMPSDSAQRQNSAQANAAFGSPGTAQVNTVAQRQPLQSRASFPTPPRITSQALPSANSGQSSAQNPQSTIAKWAAPASLPPKPPPTALQSQLPKVNDSSSLPPHPYANGKVNGGNSSALSSR
ncbi:MAG: hypothetical protein M1822_001459 [Bathelium mastoideum]|nr:MAG: hypothetical protein M1822_001459 [Bathelium mastoideum]